MILSEPEVKVLGDRMASITKSQAEDLRRYIIEKYEILPGCVEGLVWKKHGLMEGIWVKEEAKSDLYVEFCRTFVPRG